MAGAPYLTRMRSAELDPASLSADITVGQAPSDEPYREVVTTYHDISIADDYAVMGIALCLAAFSPIAFVIALGIRRRIERIAPRPER